jgi:hypothetical protein
VADGAGWSRGERRKVGQEERREGRDKRKDPDYGFDLMAQKFV